MGSKTQKTRDMTGQQGNEKPVERLSSGEAVNALVEEFILGRELNVAVFGDKKRIKETLEGFHKSSGFIRKSIAPKLGLKYMPELKFVYDDSFDKAAKMDELIKSASSGIPEA